MKLFWAALCLLFLPLGARALDPLPEWTGDNLKAWWPQNPTPAQWPQAARDLRAQLDADYQKNGAAVFSQADFQGWMDHFEWIQLGLNATDQLAKPGTSRPSSRWATMRNSRTSWSRKWCRRTHRPPRSRC